MKLLPNDNPYSKALVDLMHSIAEQIEIEKPDIIMILILLNTEEKATKFAEWVMSKMDGERLMATAAEITRAAVRIGDGNMNLP